MWLKDAQGICPYRRRCSSQEGFVNLIIQFGFYDSSAGTNSQPDNICIVLSHSQKANETHELQNVDSRCTMAHSVKG